MELLPYRAGGYTVAPRNTHSAARSCAEIVLSAGSVRLSNAPLPDLSGTEFIEPPALNVVHCPQPHRTDLTIGCSQRKLFEHW